MSNALAASGATAGTSSILNRWWAPAVAAALLALVVYGDSIRGTFVFDDYLVILYDGRMPHPSLWGKFWTYPYVNSPDKPFRPLLSMSFAIQYWLHGQVGWPFHLVNILLHAAASAAVAELARRLSGIRAAWFAGLLFAVHPVHIEAVANIVGRAELACGLATFGALCLFLGRPLTVRRVAAICACFVVAVLTKEQGMLFPLLILVLAPFRFKGGIEPGERQAVRWLVAGLCYLLAGYVVYRESMIGFFWDRTFLEWVLNPLVRSRGIDRVLMPLVLIGRYAVLLVAPHRLSVDYGGTAIGWVASPRDPYLYLGIAVVIAWIIGLAVVVRRRNWAATFCLLGLALTYGMVGNIVALIGPIFAERIMYLPSAFILILAGMAAAQVSRAVVIPILAALVLASAMMSIWYVRLWNHPMALFQQFIKNQPGSERVYDLLFREYAVRDQWRKAREIAGESIHAAPESDRPYAMCIDADLAMGDAADAWAMYNRGMGACHGFERLYLLPYGRKIESYKPAADSKPKPIEGRPK